MLRDADKNIASKAITIGEKVLPPKSRRRNLVKGMLLRSGLFTKLKGDAYVKWVKREEPNYAPHKASSGPLISIVVPCYNTPKKYLTPLVESILSQTYDNWQLCLLDGGSSPEFQELIRNAAKQDERITHKRVNQNLGIAGNTNAALDLARGEFVAFMDHDDTLAPFALSEVAACLKQHPDAELIYSDEDLINEKGTKRFNPFFKGGWSPDLLLSHNYITHLVVAKRTLVKKIGGIREGVNGAQDHDFLLRITEQTSNIYHIPKVLYHWRMAENSTAKNIQHKQYALSAGVKAVQDALNRRGVKASVVLHPDHTAHYQVLYEANAKQTTHVVLSEAAVGLDAAAHLLVILSRTNPSEPHKIYVSEKYTNVLSQLTTDHNINTYPAGQAIKFVKKLAAQNLKDNIVFVDLPVIPLSKDGWINELVGPLQQPHTVAVTGMIFDQDGWIVDFGLAKKGEQYTQIFRDIANNVPTEIGFSNSPRNFTSISGALFALRAKTIAANDNFCPSPEFFDGLRGKQAFILGWPGAQFMAIASKYTDDYISPNVIKHRNHFAFDDFFKAVAKPYEK